MTSKTVTEAAVEAAAKALHDARERSQKNLSTWGHPICGWDDLHKYAKACTRDRARAALEAALPLLVAGEREKCRTVNGGVSCHHVLTSAAAVRADKGGE